MVNASTLVVGGGVQVALNFIKHTFTDKRNEYYYLLSKQLYNEIKSEFNYLNYHISEISPAKLIAGKLSRKEILLIEQSFNPDIVYSIGAPSYIKFKSTEVLRLTNPWIIGASRIAYSTYPFFRRYLLKLKVVLQRRYINRNSCIITQTNSAGLEISKNLKIKNENIFIIPNVQSLIFNNSSSEDIPVSNEIKIFSFAAPHPHKNLSIIPQVAKELLDLGIENFVFIVTIPDEDKTYESEIFFKLCKDLKVEDNIKNIGKVSYLDAPKRYQQAQILFLPTLLEVFSVTYLESMAMKLPIVTTDFSFSREVCGEAALYYEPKNPKDAASKLFNIISNNKAKHKLLEAGKSKMSSYYTSQEIYSEHIIILEKIVNKQNNK